MRGLSKYFLLGCVFCLVLVYQARSVQLVPSWWNNGPPRIIWFSTPSESYIWGDTLPMRWDFENNSEIPTDTVYSGYVRNFSLLCSIEGEGFAEWGLNFSDYRREYLLNFSENHFTSTNLFQKVNFTFVVTYLGGADEWGPAYPDYKYSVEYTWMGYGMGNFALPPVQFFLILFGSIAGLSLLSIYGIHRYRHRNRYSMKHKRM